MYKTILFDIDGTLLDSEKNLLTAFQSALRDVLHISRGLAELEAIIGLHKKKRRLCLPQIQKNRTAS